MWPFLSNTGRQARAFTRYEAAGCHLLQRASVESCKLRLHEAGARQPGLICISSFEALLSRGCFAKQTHSLQYTWSELTSKIYQLSDKCLATLSQLQSLLAHRLMTSLGLAPQHLQ